MLGIQIVKKNKFESLKMAHELLVPQMQQATEEVKTLKRQIEYLQNELSKRIPKRGNDGKFIKIN